MLIGSFIGVLLPSMPSVIIEQSVFSNQQINFSIQIFKTLTQNIGILMIDIAFLSVSKNSWLLQRQKIYFLIVYSHDGIALYSKKLGEIMKPESTVLLAGAFSAVASLIKESTNTTGKIEAILLEGKELRLIAKKKIRMCSFSRIFHPSIKMGAK